MYKDIGNTALSLVNKVLDSMSEKGLQVNCSLTSVNELFIFADNCLSLMKFHYTFNDKPDYHNNDNYLILKQLVNALITMAYTDYYRYDFDLFISSVMSNPSNSFNSYNENDIKSIYYRNIYYEKFYKAVFNNWDNPDVKCLNVYGSLGSYNIDNIDVKRDLYLRALNIELFGVVL